MAVSRLEQQIQALRPTANKIAKKDYPALDKWEEEKKEEFYKRIEALANEVLETCEEQVEEQIWLAPMPSHKEYLKNKEINIDLYGAITLESNWDGNSESQRHISKKKLNERKEDIMELCGISERTYKRYMPKLKNISINGEAPLITTDKGASGTVFKLNYSVGGKYFVTIESDILKFLVNVARKDVLRLYIFLKVQLANGSKQMQREFIASNIGYSNDDKALDKITDMIKALVAFGLITKEESTKTVYNKALGKKMPKTLITYNLTSYDCWKEYYKKL